MLKVCYCFKSLWINTNIPRKAIREISSALGEDSVSYDEGDLLSHSYSEYSTTNSDIRPVAVAFPKSTEEVSQIAKICSKYHVPMGKTSIICYRGADFLD